MSSTAPDFEKRPATKQDIADVRLDLTKTEGRINKRIDRLETKVDTIQTDVSKIKDGVDNIERLLTGRPDGLIPRLKRVEEAVGIRPGE